MTYSFTKPSGEPCKSKPMPRMLWLSLHLSAGIWAESYVQVHIAVEIFPIEPIPEVKALQTARSRQEPSSKGDVADMPEEWRIPPPSAAEDLSEIALGQPSDASIAAETLVRQPRIKVTGFVATEPNVKPTPSGKPRVQFLVAEHPPVPEGEEEQTVYHRVYTLNKTAARVQEKGGLEKGKKVAVDGYVQKRTRKNKNHEDEEYEVVYANNVRVVSEHKFTPKPPIGREPVPKE